MDGLAVVILAAGQGTRMKSKLPKVLHPVAGWPMLRHVISAASAADPTRIVVIVGHGADRVREAFGDSVSYALQSEQLGTGHAVAQAAPVLADHTGDILVLCGDTPLIRGETVAALANHHRTKRAVITMLTGRVADPTGYGRIVRDANGTVRAIIEERSASPAERMIDEINSGVYCFQSQWLWPRLSKIGLSEKGEYYLTDLIAMAVAEGSKVETVLLEDSQEVAGINNREQLAEADAALRWRIRRALMQAGVTLLDPATTYVDAGVTIGPDTTVYPGCIIEGDTTIGEDCVIGPYSHLVNARVGDRCRVRSSVIEDSTLSNDVGMGPFSRIRQGAVLAEGVDLGNFAEIKKSTLGRGTKMHHFSYLGDATVGERVNIGAGTITCNFDSETGVKSPTVLEDDVAVGSDTMLVAPVTVGEGSSTGAGSVVTTDIPPESVAVGAPARVIRPSRRQKMDRS